MNMSEEKAIVVNFFIGCVLSAAIFVSYIPQHAECVQLRSAQGLSLWTILISSISCTFAFLSSLLSDWHAIHATGILRVNTSGMIHTLHIANACMPTIQNLVTIVAGTPTYAIYYFKFTRKENSVVTSASNGTRQPRNGAKYWFEVTITAICWLLIILVVSGSVWVLSILGSTSKFVIELSKFWGFASAITNTVQWIPQIHATWTAQHEGILSVSSLIISVLSDVLVAIFWIVGPGETLWIYMSLATDAILQVVLIGMIYCFRLKRRRSIVSAENDDGSGNNNLLTPLMLLPTGENEPTHEEETVVHEDVVER
jgi:PQ loop repeat